MKIPALRTMESIAVAKDVDDTKLLDTTAHDPNDTVNGTNSQKEYVEKGGKPAAPYGATGRNG